MKGFLVGCRRFRRLAKPHTKPWCASARQTQTRGAACRNRRATRMGPRLPAGSALLEKNNVRIPRGCRNVRSSEMSLSLGDCQPGSSAHTGTHSKPQPKSRAIRVARFVPQNGRAVRTPRAFACSVRARQLAGPTRGRLGPPQGRMVTWCGPTRGPPVWQGAPEVGGGASRKAAAIRRCLRWRGRGRRGCAFAGARAWLRRVGKGNPRVSLHARQ